MPSITNVLISLTFIGGMRENRVAEALARIENQRSGSACMADRSLGERQHKSIGTPPSQVPETQSYDTTQPSTGVGAWRKEQDMQMTRVPLSACLLPSTVSCAFHVLYTSVGLLCALEHDLVLVSSVGEHCRSSRTTCRARRVWAMRCSTPATSAARTFLDFILT
jgi:hypothetical protein